jgi:O-antigen ligase
MKVLKFFMENMNSTLEKVLYFMIYGSLMTLAIGLLTSITLLALSHILMIVPAIYFLRKSNFRNFPKSAWALLSMIVLIVLSIVTNQDISIQGYSAILKTKYFIFGFISIAPLAWYFKKCDDKKITWLLYMFCIAASVATIAGLIGLYTGTNPILMKAAHPSRNGGLFGMLMNYAHNLTYFLIIIVGILIYREKLKKFININFVIAVFIINSIGLYFTYTRGAWLGFLVAIPFYFYKEHKKIFIGIFAGLLITGIAAYYVAGANVIRPQSEVERISQWQAAVKAFQERPILGFGYLNFEHHSGLIKQRYNLPAKNFVSHAHSNFFEMLADTGIVGLTSFILWICLWFKEMNNRDDVVSKIGLAFIIVFIVGGLTQSTISLGINLFFIIGGYAVTSMRGCEVEC